MEDVMNAISIRMQILSRGSVSQMIALMLERFSQSKELVVTVQTTLIQMPTIQFVLLIHVMILNRYC